MTLNAIVTNSLLTEECEAFSNVSLFWRSHWKRNVFKNASFSNFCFFHLRFRKAPFSERSNANTRQKRRSFTPFSYENGAVKFKLLKYGKNYSIVLARYLGTSNSKATKSNVKGIVAA